MTDTYAPWISDPGDPNDGQMTAAQSKAAAAGAAALMGVDPASIDRSSDGPIKTARNLIMSHTLAWWAQYFAKDDLARIDNAVRTGLIAGQDNTEIARRVVGSQGVGGIDGVTEVTRHRITYLGRAAVKVLKLRKKATGTLKVAKR